MASSSDNQRFPRDRTPALPPPGLKSSPSGTGGYAFSPKDGTGTGAGSKASGTGPTHDEILSSTDSNFDSLDGVPTLRTSVDEIEKREERLSCSFPGLMKILIPERSFVPTTLAVRVTNLSVSGAMIEVHDQKHLNDDIALANRFFELKIAHPEIPVLRGTVAWSDVNREKPILGLSCFDRLPQFEDVVLAKETTQDVKSPPPLPAPDLEPYAPITPEGHLTITGRAKEALEIVVRGSAEKYSAKVVDGKFQLRLDLTEEGENHFSVRSVAGARKSRAVPVRVTRESINTTAKRRAGTHFDARMEMAKNGTETVVIEFAGTVQQAERVLFRFSQLMSSADRVTFDSTIVAQAFDRNLFKALKGEGPMLLNDTSRSNQAAELLDELL